ncbi:unnamed protein product [marine sediment metagenome]|uniref:Uncharacterized protein n=1 Tax=marine sediment metagenome TaxID=412755 RepID=X1B5Z5_9ZZZZ
MRATKSKNSNIPYISLSGHGFGQFVMDHMNLNTYVQFNHDRARREYEKKHNVSITKLNTTPHVMWDQKRPGLLEIYQNGEYYD